MIPDKPTHSRWMLFYLMLTAVTCGALIMVVEVLGSRVIGPFFGVSLFIWTSLIAVTLISLSLGYALGGWFADRKGRPEYLYAIILLAGLAVLAIPFLKAPVLKLCVPMGLRLGTFVSTTLLFGPSLFLLGCVSPYLIKIAAREMHNIGRTVGGFYAISTVGSVIGTALTGFVLIAYLGVDRIFHLVGLLLICLSLGYFLLFRRIWWSAALLLIPLLLGTQEKGLPSLTMENGTQVSLIASHDSYYGSLKVIDYRYGERGTREMIIDGLIQGGLDLNNDNSVYAYPYFLQFLPYALHDELKTGLVIGLGAGLIPRWFEQQGITTDVVDIDPAVFEFAHRYFDVKVSGEEITQDARYFLQNTDKRYDVVVLDVFTGDTTPGHLLSLEALQLAEQRLAERGILTINLVGDLKSETYMTASVIKTLQQVFDQVEIYPTFDLQATGGSGNLAVLAYQGAPRRADFSRLAQFKISPLAAKDVRHNLGQRFEFPASTPAIILTDDYNPLDFFDANLKEGVRRDILNTTEWDILIHSG